MVYESGTFASLHFKGDGDASTLLNKPDGDKRSLFSEYPKEMPCFPQWAGSVSMC